MKSFLAGIPVGNVKVSPGEALRKLGKLIPELIVTETHG